MSAALLEAVEKPSKARVTIAAACVRCRSRKVKCDGQRPCHSCQHSNVDCAYTTLGHETVRAARKRTYDAAFRDREHFQKLFTVLATADTNVARALYDQIRRGRSPSQIMATFEALQEPVVPRERSIRDMFFTTLVQSTASVRELASFAAEVFGPRYRLMVPASKRFQALRDRRVTIEQLSQLLEDDTTPQPQSSFPLLPTVLVPASPWTALLHSELDASHFISLFLAFLNPYWSFVEQDAFVEAMRSRDTSSPYCSSFLVNAILALASLYTEHDDAFRRPGHHLFVRGEHFYDEAKRIWNASDQAATVCNIQGLLILVYFESMRGKDMLGAPLLSIAIDLDKKLPLPCVGSQALSEEDVDIRVRHGAAQAVALVDAARNLSLHLPCNLSAERLDTLAKVVSTIPASTVSWTAYPMIDRIVWFQPSLLLNCRHELLLFAFQVERLRQDHELNPECWSASAMVLLDSMQKWYQDSPVLLISVENLMSGHFDFLGHAHSVALLLCDIIDQRVMAEHDLVDTFEGRRTQAHMHALRYARYTGSAAKLYRETWGLKIVPATSVQAAALASICLLRDIRLSAAKSIGGRTNADAAPDKTYLGSAPLSTTAALEECFRTLLAAGSQQGLCRSVAEMIYSNALLMREHMLHSTQRMFVLAALHWSEEEPKTFRLLTRC